MFSARMLALAACISQPPPEPEVMPPLSGAVSAVVDHLRDGLAEHDAGRPTFATQEWDLAWARFQRDVQPHLRRTDAMGSLKLELKFGQLRDELGERGPVPTETATKVWSAMCDLANTPEACP